MVTLFRNIKTCRLATIYVLHQVSSLQKEFHVRSSSRVASTVLFDTRNMSQKSITSFFKITPKKAAEAKQETPVKVSK